MKKVGGRHGVTLHANYSVGRNMMPNLGIFGPVVEEKPRLDAWLFRWGIGVDESRARRAKESTTWYGSPQLPMRASWSKIARELLCGAKYDAESRYFWASGRVKAKS